MMIDCHHQSTLHQYELDSPTSTVLVWPSSSWSYHNSISASLLSIIYHIHGDDRSSSSSSIIFIVIFITTTTFLLHQYELAPPPVPVWSLSSWSYHWTEQYPYHYRFWTSVLRIGSTLTSSGLLLPDPILPFDWDWEVNKFPFRELLHLHLLLHHHLKHLFFQLIASLLFPLPLKCAPN